MKLYIIRNVLNDYTSGMVIIKAEDLEQARGFFAERFQEHDDAVYEGELIGEFDVSIKNDDYTVLDLAVSDQTPAGIVQIVWGGG